MASASRATVLLSSPAASGATMPAAVIVATVAEPVASRMPTATSQPRTSALMLQVLRPVRDEVTDAGVDEHLLEAAAGGDDQQDAGDRRAASRRAVAEICSRPKPTAVPRVNIATGSRRPAARSSGCR